MPALPVVLPLIVAAVMAAGDSLMPRRVLDVLSIATAAGLLAVGVMLTAQSLPDPIVYWLGNWKPAETTPHYPIGICFVIDPLAGAMVCMVSLLVLMGFIFSWRYFESVQSYFHAVVLVFAAGMNGLCLTGDLFNLFVFFELMTAAAVMLCGYKSRNQGPLQGALNFAVVNTVGAFISLLGIGLVYSYTGTLNMAEAGRTLAAHPPPGGALVPVCLALVLCGFLAKAAAFPFHFWLADAHAVAPTPVSVLFSGVMVELGLYACWRVYTASFAQEMEAHARSIEPLFLVIGSFTAVVGGALAFMQRHLKRLLAFSTVSHMGLMFLGVALLAPRALAGAGLYLLGHGLVKGALFFCAGILLHHFESVDEYELAGHGRGLFPIMILMFLAGLGLAGLPPFATAFGASMIHRECESRGLWWVEAFFILGGLLTAGAVFRVTARIFWGVGERQGSFATAGAPRIGEEQETIGEHGRTPLTMWMPPALMIIAALGLALPRAVRETAVAAAGRAMSTHLFQESVLNSAPAALPAAAAPLHSVPEIAAPVAATILAVALCAVTLYPRRLLGWTRYQGKWTAGAAAMQLRKLHSGRVGDYVAWLVLGIAVYGAILLL